MSEFLLWVPGIAYAVKAFHVIPPFEPLNDLLQRGVQDAGMSGGCEWSQFQITREEYDELVEEWLTAPELDAKVARTGTVPRSWREWEEVLVREHQDRGRNG